MRCPKCAGKTTIKDSRLGYDGLTRRRHRCKCGNRFNTVEVLRDEYSRFCTARYSIAKLDELWDRFRNSLDTDAQG